MYCKPFCIVADVPDIQAVSFPEQTNKLLIHVLSIMRFY